MSSTGGPPVFDHGDIAWVLASTALVFIMVPGIGYFYSGMARSKNALSLILLSVLSVAVVSVQWWLFGFSLAFGSSPSHFIGTFEHAFLMGVDNRTISMGVTTVPSDVYAIFQCMFAAVTPALAIGSAAERGRIIPMIIFIFVWTTLVYDVIACWTWNPDGWAARLGVLDYAGGTPVHIASGSAALAYAIVLGKRNGHGTDEFKPHNVANVVLGTALLWFGWFGFNGGSALAANGRAAMACVVTNLSASVGGLTWCLLDFRLEKKLSALGFCSGAVAGLVTITPGSGYVDYPAAVAFGFLGGLACNMAVRLKHIFNYDDALDVFAVHAVGGFVGNLLTGIFASQSIIKMIDPTETGGGWINRNWIQIAYQLTDSVAGMAYSFLMTFAILWIMDKIPGLSIRSDLESEAKGLDESELGELAYYHVDRLVCHTKRISGHDYADSVKQATIM
ncbi:ammonium transporter 1 [Gigaspora margarita]|uniref:Ammonium transporter n=2 Tax=Gigaspora margarita TaxID=4874 RepID=A0A8H4ADW1_GIGMA|nr:ammonium transporter 1 [Gigaspora margarita]